MRNEDLRREITRAEARSTADNRNLMPYFSQSMAKHAMRAAVLDTLAGTEKDPATRDMLQTWRGEEGNIEDLYRVQCIATSHVLQTRARAEYVAAHELDLEREEALERTYPDANNDDWNAIDADGPAD